MPRRVLLVCTGNTCRSPMAEALLNRLLKENGLEKEVTVSSAGMGAVAGQPASEGARRVLAAMGIDLDGHRSRPVAEELLSDSDLILAMTVSQRDELRRRFPYKRESIWTLKEYAGVQGDDLDVVDPFGADDEEYRATAEELRRLLERVVERWTADQSGTRSGE